jgi:hypothetical protein
VYLTSNLLPLLFEFAFLQEVSGWLRVLIIREKTLGFPLMMRDNLTRTVYWYLFPLRVQTDAPGSPRRCSLAHVCSKQISPLQSCLRLMLRIILQGWENCDGILISSPVFERATIMCQLAEPILTSILSEKTSIFLLMVPLPPQTLGLQASQAELTRPKEYRSRWGCRVWIWTRVSAFFD